MVGNIIGLYPNIYKQDRRQQSTPVESDRRSGLDRRLSSRHVLEPGLKKDITDTKALFQDHHKNGFTMGILGSIPFVRRISGVQDATQQGDYTKAAGKGLIAAASAKSDFLDLANVFKPSNIPKDCQIPFSFTQNTLFEKLPGIDTIKEFDKPLSHIKVGRKFLDKIGCTIELANTEKIAFKFGGKLIPRIIGRSLSRIPILGIICLGILEIPSIIKADNHLKQVAKSTMNVSLLTLGGAIFGSIGAMLLNTKGSLLGLSIGTWLGNKAAKAVNKTF
ncbi:MAG: hypothetical protein A2287_06190 [Candidatus Melainabacteria bacterium RIFOXYA12_FULL_32_12]|nr:MAG: hypothetical protein A2287_06190 [Candidatus Melainabacteria bacterium RIFOXYA12_FULL_32_12]